MNHRVPDFALDDEYSIPNSSSSFSRHKAADEDNMKELLWHDGHVIVQRSLQKSPSSKTPRDPPPPPQPPPPTNNTQLCMAEDEMAAWLHYPLDDIYPDLFYPPPPPPPPLTQSSAVTRAPDLCLSQPQPTTSSRPPAPAAPQLAGRNFPLFSRISGKPPPPAVSRAVSTVVESNDTPAAAAAAAGPASLLPSAPSVATSVGEVSPSPVMIRESSVFGGGGGGTNMNRGGSGDMKVTSSASASASGGSGAAATTTTTAGATAAVVGAEEAVRKREVGDRKRKVRETTAATMTEFQTEDLELESADDKKHSRGATATKRSRAAEVHNLSERRRRDRINEKMKALQELIPRCNKSDKASMLDEAIEYLKSLQMQVQMMSMGCGMVPMMYPGMQQQYMPVQPMGMGMGLGMDMGMNRPVVPFPPAVPGSSLPTNLAAAVTPQLAPRVPLPAFPMHPVPTHGLSAMQPSNQADSIRSSFPLQSSGLPQLPNMADPYQHYLAVQQMQMQMQLQMQMQMQQVLQNQSLSQQPGSSKPSTSKSEEDYDDNQCG